MANTDVVSNNSIPSTMTDMMSDCLTGLKVVDLTRNLPGPFATRLLADLGAKIVKIEPENGDPGRAFGELFKALNHGKHCEKVDFRSEAGIEAIKAHIKDADVMLDSFRPEVLVGMGLDAATLHAINPKLVMVSITGYGIPEALDATGKSWAAKAGHDINFMAMSGTLDQLKTESGDQAMPNMQFADLAGGSDTAVIALLAAVLAAKNTGRGRHIAVSMTHSLYHHLVMPKATADMMQSINGQRPEPQNDFLGGWLPCYRLYKTQDGRHMAVGSLEFKFWQLLCETLALSEHVDAHWQRGSMSNTKESQAAEKAMTERFASQTMAHWQRVFAEVDACVTPVLNLAEAQSHPLFAHQDKYQATASWQVIACV
ncbi:CaiB/BaiF CoA-transferase family protein [Psychrobacter sp. FBL11]|uniref:CaiB/BaiF CoA-transferase family protein n=1 Tax=Psychrobacter saeujeotis TaxID=3143436 RepID=A0ABU9XAB5_9GAMM|nr:CaiB/BaiF CoA-transferase family protein [uncultured Psychrobacter sp.]